VADRGAGLLAEPAGDQPEPETLPLQLRDTLIEPAVELEVEELSEWRGRLRHEADGSPGNLYRQPAWRQLRTKNVAGSLANFVGGGLPSPA